ncbi:hypothetical protein TeGR_g9721 [Tetraparma gracilis]|uniref:Uncharacterized protein n=1 Tax=Tetraparma gracilis TaxID=2962635 RepID=A0ABQ6M438_9STRA|nr:hypothetical protein TeGR_g9721 [Tetraparma gracilis]
MSPDNIAASLADSIADSQSGKDMCARLDAAHSQLLLHPGVALSFAGPNRISKALHRVLSTPPSSARDHEVLSASLRLISCAAPHLAPSLAAALSSSLARVAASVLDRGNVTPSMAADGLDVNGYNKPSNRYGSEMSSKEAARFERRATRALRALWGARHELLRTLYTLLDSENREDSTRHVGTGTNLPALLCKHYVEPIKVESYSPQILELTGRSQSNAISLLHLLVEDGACAAHWCSAGIPDVGDDSGATSTMVERLVPRLISIVDCSARMPDSFLLKAGARAAAPLLKTLAGCCLLTGSTEGGLTAENSRMQQREKRNWCGGGDSLAWVMKLISDRESITRSCGFGICGDLLQLAWARPLVMSRDDDSDSPDSPDSPAAGTASLLEMACRVAADDSESAIVRCEALGLLNRACKVGGAAVESASVDVIEVIPSIGRMLARAAKFVSSVDSSGMDGDATDATSTLDGEGAEEEGGAGNNENLPTPTLLCSAMDLLRTMLQGVVQQQQQPPAPANQNEESPDSSNDSSILMENELATHFYESGVLSHAISLLSVAGMKQLTLKAALANLVFEDVDEVFGLGATYMEDVWTAAAEGSTMALRALVFDVVNLSVFIGRNNGGASDSSSVTISQSLLRHTPILSQCFRTLTTEVIAVVRRITQHAEDAKYNPSTDLLQLVTIASCCELLATLVDDSAVKAGPKILRLRDNLLSNVGNVPQAVGVSFAALARMCNSFGGTSPEIDAVCTSMNRLLRFLFAVPAWGTGMLAGGGLLPAILELHHERSLKRTNAANLPLTERVMALDVRGVLSFEGRIASSCALAAAFDACESSTDPNIADAGSEASYLAVPDLLDELNDILALIAVDGLRTGGRKGGDVDKDLVFEASGVMIVIRSAVALRGGKDAALEGRVPLVSLLQRLWPIAATVDRKTSGGGASILDIVLGLVLNFVSGSVSTKKVLDQGSRGGGESMTGKVVSLVLRKPAAKPTTVGLGLSILQSLALPPSPARSTLNCSGLYASSMKMVGSIMRTQSSSGNATAPRARSWTPGMKEKVDGCVGLIVNATLDEEGRAIVFKDWKGFEQIVDDLITVDEVILESSRRMVLLLLRNACLGKFKGKVLGNETWLGYVLDKCSSGEASVRLSGLMALWSLLYRSEKAVGVVRGNERHLGKVVESERGFLERRRRGEVGGLGELDDAGGEEGVAMRAVMTLLRSKTDEADEGGDGLWEYEQ